MNYEFKMEVPTAEQVLPIENLANPLNTVIGNENLRPSQQHDLYFNYNDYDYASRSGYYLYTGFNLSKNGVTSSTVFDANFKSTTTYQNVDKGLMSYFGASWSKSFKKEKRTLRFSTGLDMNYNINQGLTNAVLYESRNFVMNPKVNLTWSIDGLITIAPSYRYSYSTIDYKNYLINNANTFKHSGKIEITSYYPSILSSGAILTIPIIPALQRVLKRTSTCGTSVWAITSSKNQFLAKVKVYDLLDQNLNSTRTITSTAIIDAQNTVLKR